MISTRNAKKISIDNGNFLHTNHNTITLGDYIPFYFGVKMPMLYVIQIGGNFVEKPTPPQNIIYLACSLIKIINLEGIYYFSDGHATDILTSFYDNDKISELPKIIDWQAVKAPFWGGQENLNIKRKKQAEFLHNNDLPFESIVGFGCYNETAKENLIHMGINHELIKIIPNAYY